MEKAPENMVLHKCTKIVQMWRVTDAIFIIQFLPFYPPNDLKNQNF